MRNKGARLSVRVGGACLSCPRNHQWMIKRYSADLTSRSLQDEIRRGTLVVPVESRWIDQDWVADLTSRSLQTADPTSGPKTPFSKSSRPRKLKILRNQEISPTFWIVLCAVSHIRPAMKSRRDDFSQDDNPQKIILRHGKKKEKRPA